MDKRVSDLHDEKIEVVTLPRKFYIQFNGIQWGFEYNNK